MSRHELTTIEIEEIRRRKEKPCSKCKVPKPLAFFGKNPSSIDGRTAECSECNRKRQTLIRMARRITHYV